MPDIDVNVTTLPEVLNVSFDDYVGSPYSPTVVITDISGGHHIAITHKTTEGIVTSEFDVLDGVNGYSPSVSIEDAEDGHTVTITDATGAHSYFVPDWSDDEERRASAEVARASAELLRVQAEQQRASSEETRISNETTRNRNELARSQAETSRSTAEENRVIAETARANAEATRVTAESGRVTAENARVTAENTRASEWTTKSGEIASAVNHANQVATDIRNEADRGDFDGVSVTHEWNGTTLQVTSASGTSSADLKGAKGDPGVSVTHQWNGTTLQVTSASGTSSADLKGETGDSGVYVGSTEPTDPNVNVWIDPDGGPDYDVEEWTFVLEDDSTVTKQVVIQHES